MELKSQPVKGQSESLPQGTRAAQYRKTKLLQKKAIEVVIPGSVDNDFYSIFFLRQKKGGLRPLLNLQPLNMHLMNKFFTVDHLGSIVKGLKLG